MKDGSKEELLTRLEHIRRLSSGAAENKSIGPHDRKLYEIISRIADGSLPIPENYVPPSDLSEAGETHH